MAGGDVTSRRVEYGPGRGSGHTNALTEGTITMSDTTKNTDTLGALDAEHDALTAEYQTAWTVHNDAISAILADASLRDMDARRDKALDVTEATAAQADIDAQMARHARQAHASSGPVFPLYSSVRKGNGPRRVRRYLPYGY